ncbi:MAG: electron transport complex subunit RsxE [Candidatus Omnitrophica bacterium 4484_70.1]|nr:MAG: electron transport complex subunit RsxE [Candidatus Omnitrophica bacterium 4484_70.1]
MKKGKEWIKGLWKEHPVFRMLLGMCPTLAVTTSVINAIFMGVAVIFVLFFSSLIVSLIRKLVPPQVRIAVYTVIIASFVTIVDIYFKANFPQMSKALGPYVPLIIVNCIILGRCEAFASKNRLIPSLIDALSIGIGFFWGLVVLGAIREILGTGRVLGIKILSASYYNPMVVMILPAGAFLVLGGLVAIMNKLEGR